MLDEEKARKYQDNLWNKKMEGQRDFLLEKLNRKCTKENENEVSL